MPSSVEKIVHRRVDMQNSLRLRCRVVSPHPPLTDPGRIMKYFRLVLGILCWVVDSVLRQLMMSDAIAS